MSSTYIPFVNAEVDETFVAPTSATEEVEFPWRGHGGDLGPGNRPIDDGTADASNDDEVCNKIHIMNQEIRGLNQEVVALREQALEQVFVDARRTAKYDEMGTYLEAAEKALTEARHQLATAEAVCAANDAEIRRKQALQEKLKPYLKAAFQLEKLTELSHTLHQDEKVEDLMRRWKRLMVIIRECQDGDRVPEREETNEMDELLNVLLDIDNPVKRREYAEQQERYIAKYEQWMEEGGLQRTESKLIMNCWAVGK